MSIYTLPNKPALEDIITEIGENLINGWIPVYNEEIVFDTDVSKYDLVADGSIPVNIHDIVMVKGTMDGTEHTFMTDTDYALIDSNGDGKYDQIEWVVAGEEPDDGTKFYVTYRYQATPTGLTDFSIGSVLRTLVEAFSIQLYRAFLKIEEVGRDSFVDTAVGRRLDLLGRIVSVIRNEATRSTGYVTLKRDPANTTSIVDIPIGTRLSTIGTSTTPVLQFQTTKQGRIQLGETTAVTYTSEDDPDHLQPWIAVESVDLGVTNNISAGAIIRNQTAPQSVIYVNNEGTYDMSGEQFNGDGTTQVFNMSHSPAPTSSLGTKYIQFKYGYIKQPSISSVVQYVLTGGYATGSVTVTTYGVVSGSADSEALLMDNGNRTKTTTKSFSRVDYVTFINSDGYGVGEGVGAGAVIKGTATTPDPDEILFGSSGSGAAVGTRIDSGWLDMTADADYIWLYVWQNNSWTLKSIGATGVGSNHYSYTDTGTTAGLVSWGATWTEASPYYTYYDAGPNADGQNLKIEYYPIEGETGTGDASPIETGITAIQVTEEYHHGWLDQPASSSTLSVSFTNGAGSDLAWDGTVTIHGNTDTGGERDQETLVFDSGVPDYEKTTAKKFTKVDYVAWANSDNPSEGPGEGTASSTYSRIGTTTKGENIMDEQQCGIRVDGGYLSLVGVDSDDTLKVYIWNSGWSIRTQAGSHYTYTDSGTSAGCIDWGATWTWTSPYVSKYNAGPFADGRNVKIEYVPTSDQYTTTGSQLMLEGSPTLGSTVTVSYTWANDFIDGSDTEDDNSYRTRIRTSLAMAAKGTLDAIRAAVLDIDGIEGVVVDDYSTDPTIDIGEVHVFAWTSSGLLDAATRSLVAQVVEDTRAAGVKAIVSSPTPIYLAITVTVKVDQTATSDLATIALNAEDAIATYINGLSINSPLYKSDLIREIESVDGVKYVKVNTLVVKGYDIPTATTVSQEPPYSSNPYWWFDEIAGSGQDWSSDGNIIYVNSGYVLRADTDSTGTAIDVTAEYD